MVLIQPCVSTLYRRMLSRWPAIATATIFCCLVATPSFAAPVVGDMPLLVTYPKFAATAARPLKIVFKDAAGTEQTVDVEMAALQPGETFTAASVRKATAITNAINTKLGAGSAVQSTVTTKVPRVVVVPNPPFGFKRVVVFDTITQGKVTIKNVQRPTAAEAAKWRDPTGEPGNGVGFTPGAAPPPVSPGYQGSMRIQSPGFLGTATGDDAQAEMSLIGFGILDNLDDPSGFENKVSFFAPEGGESLEGIFLNLESQLLGKGVNVDYLSDPTFGPTLSVNLLEDQYLYWAFTDTGFDDVLVNYSAVPVPAAIWLFTSGLISLIAWGRRPAILRLQNPPMS